MEDRYRGIILLKECVQAVKHYTGLLGLIHLQIGLCQLVISFCPICSSAFTNYILQLLNAGF